MATRYHHSMTYDAPAPQVYAILIDPEFQAQRCQAGDPVHAESSVEPGDGDGATIKVLRRMRIDPPGLIAKFVGNELTVDEVQAWRDAGGSLAVRDGTLTVKVPGQPAEVNGSLRLDETNGTTTVTIEADIKVSVPLVGGKVESYIAGILDKLLTKDAELGQAWLARG